MEEFQSEEEEPWYDQQDLEQGKDAGGSQQAARDRRAKIKKNNGVNPGEGMGELLARLTLAWQTQRLVLRQHLHGNRRSAAPGRCPGQGKLKAEKERQGAQIHPQHQAGEIGVLWQSGTPENLLRAEHNMDRVLMLLSSPSSRRQS